MGTKDKFSNIILTVNKNIIRVLIIILTFMLILGAFSLIYLEFKKITSPPYIFIDVATLFEAFNLILIIAIGYELIKALLLIISSNIIPTKKIIEISIIAISTKIITLEIQTTDSNIIISMALLIAALGLSYFLLTYGKKPQNRL